MKVIYVIGSMELGGAEQHLLSIAAALRQRGFFPEVFALVTGGPLTQAFVDQGIPVHGASLPAWLVRLLRHKRAVAWASLLCATAALWWMYWRRRAQIVHFFLPAAYIIGGMAAQWGPRMTRVMSRRSLNHYQSKHALFRRIEYWLHPRMDSICGNSLAVVRDLSNEGVRPDQLHLIYNGIDLGGFDALGPRGEARTALGLGDQTLVFVIVANLIPYKGHFDLIDALALIKDRLPSDWVCLCVGRDDGMGSTLRERAHAAGIANRLQLLGSRRDVPRLLKAADIGVLCSHEEGFSNAVLEGMAAALPMVVTDVGGNAEAVVDGDTGLVVPPHAPAELGAALLKMASNPDRMRLGQRGRERVQSLFSMEACIQGYIELYRRAAKH